MTGLEGVPQRSCTCSDLRVSLAAGGCQIPQVAPANGTVILQRVCQPESQVRAGLGVGPAQLEQQFRDMPEAAEHPIIGRCRWVRNLVERFMTLCEDVAGGMGGTRAVG